MQLSSYNNNVRHCKLAVHSGISNLKSQLELTQDPSLYMLTNLSTLQILSNQMFVSYDFTKGTNHSPSRLFKCLSDISDHIRPLSCSNFDLNYYQFITTHSQQQSLSLVFHILTFSMLIRQNIPETLILQKPLIHQIRH